MKTPTAASSITRTTEELEDLFSIAYSGLESVKATLDAAEVLTALERAPVHHDTHPSHNIRTGGGYAHGSRLADGTLPKLLSYARFVLEVAVNDIDGMREKAIDALNEVGAAIQKPAADPSPPSPEEDSDRCGWEAGAQSVVELFRAIKRQAREGWSPEMIGDMIQDAGRGDPEYAAGFSQALGVWLTIGLDGSSMPLEEFDPVLEIREQEEVFARREGDERTAAGMAPRQGDGHE